MSSIVDCKSLCNLSEEIYVYPNKEEAENWVNKLPNATTDGSSILTFYKDDHGDIYALPLKDKLSKKNDHLRIIGARNEMEESFWDKFKEKVKGHTIPRLAQLVGDKIIPDKPHGLLIVYEKGKDTVGKRFHTIFNTLNEKLITTVKKSETNDPSLQIDIRELMDESTLLPIKEGGCDLLSGRIYIVIGGKVHRYTFKMNPANDIENDTLYAEKEAKKELAKEEEIYTEKKVNHHYRAALRGYLKVIALGIILGLVAGGIAFAFLSLASIALLAPIGAAVVGVAITTWTIKKGVSQVAEENKDTMECGKTIFRGPSTNGIENNSTLGLSSTMVNLPSVSSNTPPKRKNFSVSSLFFGCFFPCLKWTGKVFAEKIASQAFEQLSP